MPQHTTITPRKSLLATNPEHSIACTMPSLPNFSNTFLNFVNFLGFGKGGEMPSSTQNCTCYCHQSPPCPGGESQSVLTTVGLVLACILTLAFIIIIIWKVWPAADPNPTRARNTTPHRVARRTPVAWGPRRHPRARNTAFSSRNGIIQALLPLGTTTLLLIQTQRHAEGIVSHFNDWS